MLTKKKYKPIYRTHKDSIDRDFYVPCFCESIMLERAAGFFSLHSLTLSIDGLIRFIQNKGQIHLICSPELSSIDAELIDACVNLEPDYITHSLLESITKCTLTDEELFDLDIICNMLSEGLMTIKIAYQPQGIFHEKFGIFLDRAGNKVYFNGSLNETKRAFLQNQESIRVNYSWQNEPTANFIDEEEKYFNNLWNNIEESVIVIDFPEAVKKQILNRYKRSESLEAAIDNYVREHMSRKGKKVLYSYQEEAIRQFCANGFQHFYEMATGTGKTFTSIKTIKALEEKCEKQNEKLFVVICVPQVDLQTQWVSSLQEEGFDNIFQFGGNGKNFDQTITEATIEFFNGDKNVICVAVYDTFFAKMYTKIQRISTLFMIVDEAHNLTKENLSILKDLNPKYKLGLSATIQRFSEGESKAIANFFTPNETFYYGIEDAINNDFLSKYEYYPIFVRLKEEENEKFQIKSKLLAVELSKQDPNPEAIDNLSRERSLILKQASNKIVKLKELTEGDYNFVNSVVYCGQGKDNEGEAIINAVTKVLYEKGLVVSQFTSHTIDRKKVLYEFEHGFFDTLAAIKCFDEGVDVPKLDKIYIMASDSALRQTVQRRGRVLRKCKESGKTIAYIYDMIVLPAIEAGTYGSDGILKIELSRAREYNRLANNKEENESVFQEIEKKYHITTNIAENETESV